MCHPLDDKTNPLYQQPVSAQINYIINWQQHFSSARSLFSLPKYYTQQEIVTAYRQLSKRIHPDKNIELPAANDAFTIIGLAKDFLDFVLLSTAEQRNKINQVANNPFFKAAQQNPLTDIMFSTGSGTQDHNNSPKENFNNPNLYKDQGFSAILEVLERGRKTKELQKGLHDFCPFKLPSAAKERLAKLMAQDSTTESINIVDWLNLCRYQDDFDFFQQLCDYTLSQKHQAPLAQIKDFLPKSDTYSDNSVLVNHLFAVIDARTAHFVMSQLSRFIDTKTQDELLDYFKDWQLNAVPERYRKSYHVVAAFLGWHSSSELLRTELRNRIKSSYSSKYDWQINRNYNSITDKELYFDKDYFAKGSMVAFKSKSACSLPVTKEQRHFSVLLSVLREQGVFTASEALYIASDEYSLDEISTILSKEPQLPLNPYYLLYSLISIDDVFNSESWNKRALAQVVLPGNMASTRANVITCITRLFKQILAHAQLSPEQLSELFLFLLENNRSLDTHILYFIITQMDECGLDDTLQKKIWQYCIKKFTHRDDPTFLEILIKRAKPLFFHSLPLHQYLFKSGSKPEHITKILSTEPRFLSCHYAQMPIMAKFKNNDFFAPNTYANKYRIGRANGLYLHNSLSTACEYDSPKGKVCAIVEAMRAEDYALFNVPIEIPIYKNPEQYDIYHWFYSDPLLRHSRCDAMHLAAIRGLDKELLAMLQKGGDYHQKASVWRASSFFGIETLCLERKSSYQYAKEQRLPESCRWILQQEIKDYIQGRQKEEHYTTRLSLFGYTLWNGGYNREEKVSDAKALLHLIESTHFVGFGQDLDAANHLAQEHPALTQGRLGALFATYKKLCAWYEEKQKDQKYSFFWGQPPKESYADKRGFHDLSSNGYYTPTII